MRRSPWLSRIAALAAVAALSGCGADRAGAPATAGEPTPAGGSGSAVAVSVTANPAGSSSAPLSGPAGQSGTPAPIVKGELSVTLDAGEYRVGAMIQATVHNGMDRPVYTEDFKTACSIVILQRQDGESWTDITGCRLGRPTATVTIEPGMSQPVELDPASFHLTDNPSQPGFGAGTYRVKLTFRTDPAVGGPDPLAAYSPAFPVR